MRLYSVSKKREIEPDNISLIDNLIDGESIMKKKLLIASFALLSFTEHSIANDSALRDRANAIFKPVPTEFKTQISDNKITPEKIKLGWYLFFEPRLSKSGFLSCNSCHNVGLGGEDNQPKSIGHAWQRGGRNAPTVFNAVYNVAQFWDGRAEDLKAQAKGPVQASVEMNSTGDAVETTLRSMPEYIEMFNLAFPKSPKGKKAVTFDNMARAIEAYEATLITPNAPFDLFLKGNNKAMNALQKKGLALFMDRGCSSCHSGVNLGGQAYFPFGLVSKPKADILPEGDKGRFEVTKTSTDNYVFRAAPLRNIALGAPYFHSGQVWDLREAVSIMASSQLGTELKGSEIDAVVAFLESLTGEQPKVEYPILPRETGKTPKPR